MNNLLPSAFQTNKSDLTVEEVFHLFPKVAFTVVEELLEDDCQETEKE